VSLGLKVGWVVVGVLLAGWGCVLLQGADPVVSNVRAEQRAGTLAVDLTYDVADAGNGEMMVSVTVSVDGGKTSETLGSGLSGDVGGGVTPGTGKRAVWEAGVEWLGHRWTNVQFRVRAVRFVPVIPMVWVAPGTFRMGSPAGEVDRRKDEGPATDVTLSQGFWLGKYEVRQREWVEVMGSNPSQFKGDPDLPVETVSWGEATEYCRKLTVRERAARKLSQRYEYGLPTEAQWEYACRAGTKSATAHGERLSSSQGNFNGEYPYNGGAKGPYLNKTAKVGSYAPNGWGLHDMHGNVWEWCLDWYEDELPGGNVTDPRGADSGSDRVNRGGSWDYVGRDCRSASRSGRAPGYRNAILGFRLALVAVP
jgi:formylglycine-generating enzyme required for sulfatase activity